MKKLIAVMAFAGVLSVPSVLLADQGCSRL